MDRRTFIKLAAVSGTLSGCGLLRLDPLHPMIRSEIVDSPEKDREIMSKASLGFTEDGKIRVVYLKGTAYERGYQHGRLLRKEVQSNMGYIYKKALWKFRSSELFAEAYERMRPFMTQDHIDEMHGLAHGSRLPLEVIHHIHVLADIGEWGGKKQLGALVKKMMAGDLATMCSNIAVSKSATKDGRLYVVRILDWGLHRISRLHEFPLIAVNVPDKGVPYANIGWVGYLGAVSGMNAEGITLGEMGYRNPPNETLRGEPMPFMLQRVMQYSKNLEDVRRIIRETVGTNSYVFLMSDGKTGESELYVKDRDRFLSFKPGVEIHDDKEHLPPIKDTVYGGRFNETMTEHLTREHGSINPELFMSKLIPEFAMKSNFQNVIYDPEKVSFWVSNAFSPTVWAAERPYTFFDLKKALKSNS